MDFKALEARLAGLNGQYKAAAAAGDHARAQALALEAHGLAPQLAAPLVDAAASALFLRLWDEARALAERALALGPPSMSVCDVLAHAHSMLGNGDQVRLWGLRALEARLQAFSGPPALDHVVPAPPPPPSPATRGQNVIAFSLFGAKPGYCETAILNVAAAAEHYPDWTCQFHIDATVPAHVRTRLLAAGARLVEVTEADRVLPGPMWRFLAHDGAGVHRVLFRDADSILSAREADAVGEWVQSGAQFHIMRDGGSHTELMLAGLWGCVAGALPPLRRLMETFLSQPYDSAHFADQHFLRAMVWPYARTSLMQHDPIFGFLDPVPFRLPQPSADFHVGCAWGRISVSVTAPSEAGAQVEWWLEDLRGGRDRIGPYHSVSQGGRFVTELPKPYVEAIEAGAMALRLV